MLENVKLAWAKAKRVTKEYIAPAVGWAVTGAIIATPFVAWKAAKDVRELEERQERFNEMTLRNFDELADICYWNIVMHNDFVDWTHEEIERLTRENNILMEKAGLLMKKDGV